MDNGFQQHSMSGLPEVGDDVLIVGHTHKPVVPEQGQDQPHHVKRRGMARFPGEHAAADRLGLRRLPAAEVFLRLRDGLFERLRRRHSSLH